MRFNIKNWQDKHLIKESKLKEMDFKDKAAFDKYQSKHKMRKSTKVSIGGKDTTAGEAGGKSDKAAHASKLTPQQKKSVVGDAIDDVTFFTDKNGYIDLTVDKLSPIYISGMSKEDAKAEIKSKMDPATNDKLKDLSKYKLKKADKELDSLLDRMYAGEFDFRIDSDSIRSDRKDDMIVDPELDKQIKKNAVPQRAEKQKAEDEKNARISKKNADARAEKLKNRTPKEIEKAKNQFKFSEYDYQSPKEYRDNVKGILQKTYDLDKVDPDRLQQMIDGADDYFSDEARSAGKAGRRSKPTSAKDFANYIEQYFDEDGIEPKNESVAPRSARIQEAKMYQTIQELKALEKGL